MNQQFNGQMPGTETENTAGSSMPAFSGAFDDDSSRPAMSTDGRPLDDQQYTPPMYGQSVEQQYTQPVYGQPMQQYAQPIYGQPAGQQYVPGCAVF